MSKYEKLSLTGLLLNIFGVFIPWYGILEYTRINGKVVKRINELKYGYNEVVGITILILSIILFLSVIIYIQKEHILDRIYVIKIFLTALISLLYISTLITIISSGYRLHLGMAFVLAGLILIWLGLKKEKRVKD